MAFDLFDVGGVGDENGLVPLGVDRVDNVCGVGSVLLREGVFVLGPADFYRDLGVYAVP